MTAKVYKLKTQIIRQITVPIVILAAVLIMPTAGGEGVRNGLKLCTDVLIPSIFPALLATVLVVESGGATWLGRKLSKLSKKMFSLPGEAASALLLSLLGGYPAGAKAVVGLYESGAITKRQAQRMTLFCFSAGPAFLIGVIGNLTGNPWSGVILLIANSVSVMLIGVILGLVFDKDRSGEIAAEMKRKERIEKVPLSQALVVSVHKSASSMLSICLFVIVFSILRAMLSRSGAEKLIEDMLLSLSMSENAAKALLTAFLEVSAGSVLAVKAGLVFTGFFIGFGGLAVHAQVWAIAQKIEINKGLFFVTRIAQGAFTAAMTAVLLLFMPAVESAAGVALSSMPTAGGSALLMLLCVASVLCLPGDRTIFAQKKAPLFVRTVQKTL